MTQFVAKSAEGIGVFIRAARGALTRVRRVPDALARAIETLAVGK